MVILLTGASSGIGFMAAKALAAKGHKVYGAARRVELMEPLRELGVEPLRLDVTDDDSIVAAVRTVAESEGRIDVLVNNAGYGQLGPFETVPLADARRQLEVNLFGMARLTQLVLPHMRRQGSGRIVNISSIAGKAPIPYCGWYNVTKYSVEALSDDLRMEVKPFGIKVSLIEPSSIKTNWGIIAADSLRAATEGTAYEADAGRQADNFRKAYTMDFMSKPDVVAKAIVKAAIGKRPRTRYRVGRGACTVILLHALLPTRWWDALTTHLLKSGILPD